MKMQGSPLHLNFKETPHHLGRTYTEKPSVYLDFALKRQPVSYLAAPDTRITGLSQVRLSGHPRRAQQDPSSRLASNVSFQCLRRISGVHQGRVCASGLPSTPGHLQTSTGLPGPCTLPLAPLGVCLQSRLSAPNRCRGLFQVKCAAAWHMKTAAASTFLLPVLPLKYS